MSRSRNQSTQQNQGNALVIEGQLNKAKAHEASQIFTQGIRPMARKLEGYMDTVEMRSDETGHALYAIKFESEETRQRAQQRGDLQQELDRLGTIVGVKGTQTWSIDSES